MAFETSQRSYIALRDQVAERTKPLVAWVGAGLSAPAGMPGWGGLRDLLIQAGLNKAKSLDRPSRTKLEKILNPLFREANLWQAFTILKEAIGVTTYHDEIRRSLAQAPKVPVPQPYLDVWRLPLRGLINLNIDRLGTRAFLDIRQKALPNEFTAEQVGGMTHVLSSLRPFIVNLHGDAEQVSTWIFTHQDLTRLFASNPYLNFVRSCITMNTVLFLGITADDRAVGGHLEWFAKNGISTGPHFWLTDRRDADTDRWAEASDVRVIRYPNKDGQHGDVSEFFEDLLSYVPQEDSKAMPPVVSSALNRRPSVVLPDPKALAREDTEKIRELLNIRASEILANESSASYEEYEKFCDTYEEAIHRAWYVSTRPDRNKLFHYTLVSPAQRGAFGQVFKAYDESGETVAIKLLHEETRTNPELLRSFRRGVRSMKILERHHVDGMVVYKDASEIPAFVAMEWVNGPNLAEAVQARFIDAWEDILRVGRDLAAIIERAHALPERVLHRDLRPANVMLKDFYVDQTNWSVVVLDFDLSWHKDATERSVLHSTAVGYLAPEQVQARPNMSTRHAAVDSYGFGMSMFFMCTGKDPITGQHRHKDWQEMLDKSITKGRRSSTWSSLSRRVARLVALSTQDEQSKRLDMGQIRAELTRLYDALCEPTKVQSLELVAEEIASRSQYMTTYEWSIDRGSAISQLFSGLVVEVSGDETNKTVEVTFQWEKTGTEDRKRMADLIGTSTQRAAERLSAGGWHVSRKEPRMGGFFIRANVDRADAVGALQKLASAIDGGIEQVRMS